MCQCACICAQAYAPCACREGVTQGGIHHGSRVPEIKALMLWVREGRPQAVGSAGEEAKSKYD